MSMRFVEKLSLSGTRASTGSVGDAYANALAETTRVHDPGGFSVLTDIHPSGSHIRVDLLIVDPWATSVLFHTAGPLPSRFVM